MEATPRFELGNKSFADFCLTTWLCRHLDFYSFPDESGKLYELARVEGFEPSHDGIRIRCLTAWRYPNVVCGVDSGIRTHASRSHNPLS